MRVWWIGCAATRGAPSPSKMPSPSGRGACRSRLPAHRIRRRLVLPPALRSRRGAGRAQRRSAGCRRADSGTRAAFVGDPQRRRAAHGDRRRRAGAARGAALRVRPPAAAGPQRPGDRHRRHALHGLSLPARGAELAAVRPGRHRRAGLGRDRGQPDPARERRRADRAVAAEYRRVPAGSDAAANASGHLRAAARQPGHGVDSADRRAPGGHRDSGPDRHRRDRRRGRGARSRRDPGGRRGRRRRGRRQPVRDHRGELAGQRRGRGARARRLGGGARAAGGARPRPSATRPPSAASSPASKRRSTTGRRSRRSAKTSPAVSFPPRSSSRP